MRAALHAVAALGGVWILCLAVTTAVWAQAEPPGDPVLTINPERLFAETAFGLRVQRRIETVARELAAENRRIEAELIEEERALTAQRQTLQIEEFRALADQFDIRVDQIRNEQDEKGRDLQRMRDGERQRFFGLVGGLLSRILRDRGASVLVDTRNVVLALDRVEITDEAIRLIDAEIGDGSAPDAPAAVE